MTPRAPVRANQIAGLAAAIAAIRPLRQPADTLLHQFFRQHKAMGQHDRAIIADGVFAYLRRRRSLEAIAQTQSPMHLALAVLVRELGVGVRECEGALSADDALWLRALESRLATPLLPAVAADLPDWLWERLGTAYGEAERAALAEAWLSTAPLDLRVNPLKTTRDEARAALAASGIVAEPTPYSPLGLRVAGRVALARHPLFSAGALEVQDEGSQLIGFLLAPKRTDMVVDFCAGAGGKTLLLGALMRSQGRLYAFDTHDRRLANLKPRLARSGLVNVHPQLLAHERDTKVGRLAGRIDRVLVDAPCTGFGTLRRNPDLKWRQPESALADLAAQAAGDTRGRGNAGEARRPSRLRDVQRAARRERSGRRRVPRRESRLHARRRGGGAGPRRHRPRHRAGVAALSAPAWLRRFLRRGAHARGVTRGDAATRPIPGDRHIR